MAGMSRADRTKQARLPVLLYHDVARDPMDCASGLTVALETFERQVRWLSRRGYTAITTRDWLDWLHGKRALPARPVAITFDDAYENLTRYALPILGAHHFTATVFVITGLIGKETPWGGRTAMSAPQIREWTAQGIEFGGHTRTHPDLRAVWGRRLEQEILGCCDDLADVIGQRPVSFAYPYGFYTAEAVERAREAFALAFSTLGGLNHAGTDRHLLRRVSIEPRYSLPSFVRRVRVGRPFFYRARRKLTLRARIRRLWH